MRGARERPVLDRTDAPAASARFLSNGPYRVLITASGSGFSTWRDHALTPWSADGVQDCDGFVIFCRDLESGAFYSMGRRPAPGRPERYAAHWQPGRYGIERRDAGIEIQLQIGVPPELSLEIRRLEVHNRSSRRRRLEITSYAEVVLYAAAAHAAHPAFSKLFVQTEHVPARRALLARRRPRAHGETHPWLVHALVGGGDDVEHETDRARFVGRGTRPGAPLALRSRARLSGTTGNVLDPIVALRCVVDLDPDETAALSFLLGAATDRGAALQLVERCARPGAVDRELERAGTQALADLERACLDALEAECWHGIAGAMLYGHPALRAAPEILRRAHGRTADLQRLGVSPQHALAVLHAEHPRGAALLPDLLRAQRLWRLLGLPIDLIVVHRDAAPHAAMDLDAGERPLLLQREALAGADVDLLDAVARLVITDALPVLESDDRASTTRPRGDGPQLSNPGADVAPAAASTTATPTPGVTREELLFWNGHGGFAAAGREYVIHLPPHPDGGLVLPPRPWINVVANEAFGFLASETGAGCTWSRNSREHRLTPWSNDAVLDPHDEALYVLDEESGAFWSALPGPAPAPAAYSMRHGIGYSVCELVHDGLEHETTLFVPRHDPVKIARLRLRNRGDKVRRLSLFAYARLVLGALPEESGRCITTELDAPSHTLLARNPMAEEFADGIAFATVVAPGARGAARFTCDRAGFLGPGGGPAAPAALRRSGVLDGRSGPGLDACFAQQIEVEIPAGKTFEASFLLGECVGLDAVRELVARYSAAGAVNVAWVEVQAFWKDLFAGLRVATPSPALDLMVNGWLPYQTVSCRLWGRSAFYQSGGAFGFRDQLQDAAALVHLRPELVREQILLHAAHQFVEGDVLHWWHPPLGRGIRTRFVDDLLWLPYCAAYYAQTTGDWSLFDAPAPFLRARPLAPGEDEAFLLPEDSGTSAPLYEHCCRALDRSLEVGAHGLPFFGTGDWNDGMNRVGREGRGESVWMGFFLHAVLGDFGAVCERRADVERVRRYAACRERLRAALNDAGWDGEWYRRGWYDDGSPLGSRQSDECRIDALAQAWAVLSGAAPPERAAQAMDSVERHLISEDEGLIRLLTPPFENTPHDPGYIRGYVPGVRENGGQYTHAALWVVQALAELGRNDRVARLLEMLGPVSHTTRERLATYQVEPYVVAADVYGAAPHVGRGGWTWYTGSSGWMYRVALESLLGFEIEAGATLVLHPCVPDEWPQFEIAYRLPGETTRYEIACRNPQRMARCVTRATLDGEPAPIECGRARIPLAHDGRLHRVEIELGPREGGRA